MFCRIFTQHIATGEEVGLTVTGRHVTGENVGTLSSTVRNVSPGTVLGLGTTKSSSVRSLAPATLPLITKFSILPSRSPPLQPGFKRIQDVQMTVGFFGDPKVVVVADYFFDSTKNILGGNDLRYIESF